MFDDSVMNRKGASIKKKLSGKNIYSFSWPKCVLIIDIKYSEEQLVRLLSMKRRNSKKKQFQFIISENEG